MELLSQSGDRVVTSWPPMITCPCSGSYSRNNKLPRVLFPEPLGPTTAVTDPAGTVRCSPLKMGTSERDGYAKCTFLNSMPLFRSVKGGVSPPKSRTTEDKPNICKGHATLLFLSTFLCSSIVTVKRTFNIWTKPRRNSYKLNFIDRFNSSVKKKKENDVNSSNTSLMLKSQLAFGGFLLYSNIILNLALKLRL